MATVSETGAGRNRPPGRSSFPPDYRARLGLYLLLQAALFLAPGAWILAPGLVVGLLGARTGVSWRRWLARLRALWAVILLPALAGLPAAWAARPDGAAAFLSAWAPALHRSFIFLFVLAGAQWLSTASSVSEIRDFLEWLFAPLGRTGRRAALTAALALSFLPWARDELRAADDAARLRGSDPRRPARHLVSLGIPVTARLLEKARLSSEALALRDPDTEGGSLVLNAGRLQDTPDLFNQSADQG